MPRNKQSMAGSLLQTVSRLCTAITFGIATAIFDAVQKSPAKSGYYANNAVEPYAAVFWCAAAVAFPGIFLVPFLRIQTQGHAGDTGRVNAQETDEERAESVEEGSVDAEKSVRYVLGSDGSEKNGVSA